MIAVHHLDPLNLGERETDPRIDLVPVCLNCHAVMHRRRPNPYTVNEIREMLGRPPIRQDFTADDILAECEEQTP